VNPTPAKVLVSGSSGMIGRALITRLSEDGCRITRLVRGTSPAPGQLPWDPYQPISPQSVSGFDAVIHLAGESIVGRWTEAKKRAIRESRVSGTSNLSAACAKAASPPRVLISASAIGYYGNGGDEILREDSPSGSGFLPEVCHEWEAANQPAADAGIRTAQVRFGIVLSKDGGALPKMLTPFRLGLGGSIGDGQQWWSWIDLRDAVGAIRHLLNTDFLHGPVNVVGPNSVTNAQFTKALASALSRPAIFPVPAFVAKLALGQMAEELLLASQRVEPGKLLAAGYIFQYPELRTSLSAILNA
jgi:uncharacterized protein